MTVPKGRSITFVYGLVGHLHWLCFLGTTGSYGEVEQEKILAFDLGAETFREIPPPDSILHHPKIRYHVLGVLGGKLCVMSGVDDGGCEVWVMDEYGLAESWVKHHVFSQFGCEIYPFGFTSHSEFLFQVGRDDRYGLYDPVAAMTKTFKIMSNGINITKVVEHVDNLVWVAPAEHA
ncbi:unnamed protein product [Lactuca virosa]|uniref:F-box associated domain-containing protein n=1 Tax=Lactuca virosa TaxID=75947 RepID=A0AAU9N3D6_9ASTR|nr:unnamed protein product [Lactuca virosa]